MASLCVFREHCEFPRVVLMSGLGFDGRVLTEAYGAWPVVLQTGVCGGAEAPTRQQSHITNAHILLYFRR